MKKTTRLTAHLLALVLLLANISASATEVGIPLEDLDADKYAALLQAASEETSGADVTVCGTEYCNNVLYMLQQCPTAQDKYEYLMTLYTEVPDDEIATQEDLVLEYTLLHYYECHVADKEDLSTYEVCTCAFPMLAPDSVPGDISKHSEECPWHFANLTTPEQYTVSIMLASYDETAYLATLSAEQATALTTYTAQQNGTLSYPCEEKPEYCRFSEYSTLTASEIYDYFNAIYDDGNGEISDLYAAMMLHYGEYHLGSNLICTCGEHPLPLPEYEIGDISKHEDTCPWHFANLTVPEQYDVICLLSVEEQPAYYAALTPEQETVLRDYIESILGSSDACDGEECGYKAFAAMSGAERAAQLKEWVNTPSDAMGNMYNVFIAHLYDKHKDADEVCLCAEYQSDPDKYGYGTLNHSLTASNFHDQTVVCPWHFNELSAEEQYVVFVQMTVADQYRVIKDLSTDKQAEYTTKLSQEQLAALTDYMSRVGSSDQESTTEVPKSETTGAAAQITVPANTFGEGIEFVMNAEETTLNEAEQAAVSGMNIVAAFDISFNDVTTGEKIQPTNGKVKLTFTIDTSKISGDYIQVYHFEDNGDGTYTAEPIGDAELVDKSLATQTIEVWASEFSAFGAADYNVTGTTCDGDACYTKAEVDFPESMTANYKALVNLPTAAERHAYLNSFYNVDGSDGTSSGFEWFINHLLSEHYELFTEEELICICFNFDASYGGIPAPGHVPGHTETNCPWHFGQLTLEEQYQIVKDMTESELEKHMQDAELTEEQKQSLRDYIESKEETTESVCVVEGDVLMCDGVALANITETGYIIDIATGIAVGRYDRENNAFIMGTGTN